MVGQTISHFQIIDELGRGGMGVVYKGRDTQLNRLVALKFLSQSLSTDPAASDRFLQEARAVAALEHVNVCSIFEIAESPSQGPYIVMGFCDGLSLRDILATRLPEIQEVTNLARQIASGLAHAHRNGVVHRDLKPGNVMVTHEGVAKIVDFGIANVRDATTVIDADQTIGTAAYMAPEQLRGEPSDHRADIWSFGVLVHEMITGRNPFRGEYDQATIYNVLNGHPPRVRETREDAAWWDPLIQRCLEKDPGARFDSMEELLGTLPEGDEASPPVTTRLEFEGYLPEPGTRIYVGRTEEHARLLERLTSPHGTTTLVSGESGIGKTRMISRVLAERVAEGGRALWGRCLFNEGALPYHPFVTSLKRGFPIATDIASYVESFAVKNGIAFGGQRSHLRAFLQGGDDSEQVLNREQLWHTVLLVYRLLSSKERPLYLVVDDLQWGDPATVALFCYLARNIEASSIHLVGLYRPDASSSRGGAPRELLIESLRQLRIDGLADQIDLERFGRADSDRLLERMLDGDAVDEALKAHIFEQSEGLPLFLAESLNLLRLEGRIRKVDGMWQMPRNGMAKRSVSGRVQDVILQRLEALDDEDRELLDIAAVEGEVFTSEPLEACLGWPRMKVLKRLQVIEKRFQLIMHERVGYRFDHTMIRQVLLDGLLPELREEYHRLIAAALLERHGTTDDHAAAIAMHLVASGQEVSAAPYLLRAANRARSAHAFEQALAPFEELDRVQRTLLPDDHELGLAVARGLGDVHYALGDVQRAAECYHLFLEKARASGDLKAELEARRKLADSLRITGRLDESFALIERTLAVSREAGIREETVKILHVFAEVAASRGSYQDSAEYASEALKMAAARNDRANQSVAASILGFAYWHMGSFRRSQEHFSNALATQRDIGDRLGMATTLNFLALSLWKLGHFEDALRCAQESVDIKRTMSLFRAIPGSLNIIGDVYRDAFALDKAIQYHRESLDLATAHDNKGAMCDNLRDLGADYLAEGDLDNAESYMRQALALAETSGIKWYETRSAIGLAETLVQSGALEDAKQYALRGLQLAEEIQARELLIEAKWALALVIKEDDERKQTLLEEALQDADDLELGTLAWQIRLQLADLLSSVGHTDRENQLRSEVRSLVQEIADRITDRDLRSGFLEAESVARAFSG